MLVSHIQVVMTVVPPYQHVMAQALQPPWPRQAPPAFSRTKIHWREVVARKETKVNYLSRAAKNSRESLKTFNGNMPRFMSHDCRVITMGDIIM